MLHGRVGGFAFGYGSRSWVRTPVSLIWVLLLCFPSRALSAEKPPGPDNPYTPRRDQKWIQDVVDDFLARLPLTHTVKVAIVPKNALMVSVESVDNDGTAFLLSLEEEFVDELTEEELKAAIAHELGHVWIFTHHPYLQTEALANQIAMRLVTRDMLTQVYDKVWKRQGAKGDLARFVAD